MAATAAGRGRPRKSRVARRRAAYEAQGSGSGSQQALPGRAAVKRRLQGSPASKAAGRVLAARAERRFFFSLGHCCLGLLPAPRTLPSRGAPAWDRVWVCLGLTPGRWRWGGRGGGRREPAPPPALPGGRYAPFRAGPARSARPGRRSRAPAGRLGSRGGGRQQSGRAGHRARRRGAATGRGAPPPGLRRPPRLRGKETLEGPRPGLGRGARGAGPGKRPGKVTGAEAGRRAVGAGSRGRRPRCTRERSPASARRRRLRNAPASPSARHSSWAVAAAAAGGGRRWLGAGARSPPRAPDQAGLPRGSPAGGSDRRALGSGVRAGPAAACPGRRARSAAAVTVCLCHVCAAGGDREPRPGSERGRGQPAPRRPPPTQAAGPANCRRLSLTDLAAAPPEAPPPGEAPPFYFFCSLARRRKQRPEPGFWPGPR